MMKLSEIVRIARRLVMMVGGEAMQSGFHFALNLVLVHMLSAKGYGIFAIVMVFGGLSLTYIRSLTALPASISIGQSTTRSAADANDVTFGSAALLLSVLMGVGVAILLHLWLDSGAIVGGCFVGLWAMRSHLRITFFARKWQNSASLSDLVFTLSGFLGLLAIARYGTGDLLFWVFLLLAAANGLSILAMLALSRRRLRVSFGAPMRRRYYRLWPQLSWSALSVTTANLQGQGVAVLVTAIAGPAAYAPIAAVLLLFVPLRVAITAVVNMVQPDIAKLLARGDKARVWQLCRTWSAIVGAGGFAYGAAMFLVLPYIRAEALAGVPLHLIGFFAWVIFTSTMLYVMPRSVLEVMMAFRTVTLITAASAVVGAAAIVLALLLAPPAWALGGGAISEVVVLVACWWNVRQRLRRSEQEARQPKFTPAATAPLSPLRNAANRC